MGHHRSYTWEFKFQMVQLLEKGELNPSQISRDHHVSHSLLYVWWRLYQEQGEATFVPTQAFSVHLKSIGRSDPQDQIAHSSDCAGNRLSIRSLRFGGGCPKKSLASGLATGSHPTVPRAHRAHAPSRCQAFSVRKLCRRLQINPQWCYQHRCKTKHQEEDDSACVPPSRRRVKPMLGYGFSRVTKALVAYWVEDQP